MSRSFFCFPEKLKNNRFKLQNFEIVIVNFGFFKIPPQKKTMNKKTYNIFVCLLLLFSSIPIMEQEQQKYQNCGALTYNTSVAHFRCCTSFSHQRVTPSTPQKVAYLLKKSVIQVCSLRIVFICFNSTKWIGKFYKVGTNYMRFHCFLKLK